MTVLSIATLAAATASLAAAACVAYVVISFTRSADLIASRAGRKRRALVLVANAPSQRVRSPATPARSPALARVT